MAAINHGTCQDSEPEDQEYGYCVFEELSHVSMRKKVSPKADITLTEISLLNGLWYRLEVKYNMKCCASYNKRITSVNE